MAIDSHAHYNSLLTDKLDDMIMAIEQSKDIEAVINVSMDLEMAYEISKLSINSDKFYSTIGIHPLRNGNVGELLKLYNSVDNRKIVAVGETGLDSNNQDLLLQKKLFIEQIELANYLKLPVIIHALNYNREALDIVKSNKPLYGYVFHCFQPDIDIALEIIRDGGYISIGGPVTYKTAKRSLEVVKAISLDSLLVETDSPYMTPEPYRDLKNNSLYLKYIIERIAAIKNIDYNMVEETTSINAKRLFKKMK